ncbi:MFS general substrate transporter [Phanerochaete sordida]|uniref:MFS general substrate transporter n=1 Tax=Phanerochaete sordida TaxID=48140 RepID=A0A9P3LJ46_9APHY|nr:MFS general substrate transporter [Phanerochaete sordida]
MSSSASLADPEKQAAPLEPHALPHDAHGHAHARKVALSDIDVAAAVTAGVDLDAVDEQEAKRVLRKIDWHILPLMCLIFALQYADKNALGQSAVLGLLEDAHLTQNQYNQLGTVFYVFYLAAEFPQNYLLQRFPVAKVLAIDIFLWAALLMCHAAAKSFAALATVRTFLALTEAAIMPGFMVVTAMFYTRDEGVRRVGSWFLMDGTAIVVLGFIAFGCLHIHTTTLAPWQWLNIILGLITLVASVLFWFFFPDNPTTAWFLTPEERVVAVARIRVNQAGIENKKFKKSQLMECLRDPKTWMWFFYAAFSQVSNSLSNQRGLIVSEFGFNSIQTTLLGCVDGAVLILAVLISTTLASRLPNARAYVGAGGYAVGILGAILVNVLSSRLKVGLLCSYWLGAGGSFAPFVIALAWVGAVTAGHTKRVCTNAIMIIGYALGNAVGPQPWKKQYQPRNHVPWTVICVCWAVSGALMLLLRWYLARENARRDAEQAAAAPEPGRGDVDEKHEGDGDGASEEEVYLEDARGAEVGKVDKAFLDLTDIENRDFRYVL